MSMATQQVSDAEANRLWWNSRITSMRVKDEASITEEQIDTEARNGRYYSYEQHQWLTMSWLERAIRHIFACCCLESVRISCARRTWVAIEQMPEAPREICRRIEDLLLDAIQHTNPASAYCDNISRVFSKTHLRCARARGLELQQIDVQQHPTCRVFGVFNNQTLIYSVLNNRYGELTFTPVSHQPKLKNTYDSLWDAQGRRIGAIKLNVDYREQARLNSTMQLLSGKDLPLANIEESREKTTLVFRGAMTNQLFAVAHLKPKSLISWTITVVDQAASDASGMTPTLLAWAVLKYSQHHHFQSPERLSYTRTPHPEQNFNEALRALPSR